MIMSFKFFEYVTLLNMTVMRKLGYKTQKTILTYFNWNCRSVFETYESRLCTFSKVKWKHCVFRCLAPTKELKLFVSGTIFSPLCEHKILHVYVVYTYEGSIIQPLENNDDVTISRSTETSKKQAAERVVRHSACSAYFSAMTLDELLATSV